MMKLYKKILILALGSTCTFYALDMTIGQKLRADPSSEDGEEEVSFLANKAPTVKQFNKNLIAMQSPAGNAGTADFYHNTYAETLDAKGLPQLKHGKRWYNESKMEEISQSANLEPISRDE